MQIYKDTILFG